MNNTMSLIDSLKEVRNNLGAVLCDHEGNACIHGSDGDLAVINESLATLTSIIAYIESPELVEDAGMAALCAVSTIPSGEFWPPHAKKVGKAALQAILKEDV